MENIRLLRTRVNQMSLSPFELEIFRNVLSSIAEEMGMTLVRAAFSPNIK